MTVKYWLYKDELDKHMETIDAEREVEMELMDDDEKVWKKARIQIFDQPLEGSVPVGTLGTFSEPYDEGKYHIKVIEILPSPFEEE